MDSKILSDKSQLEVCRICLTTVKDVTNLITGENYSKDILERIYECFQIVLYFDKQLPSAICSNCLNELDIAYNFRKKCLAFEEKYLTLSTEIIITNDKQITIPDKDIKIEDYSRELTEDNYVSNDHTQSETDQTDFNEINNKCTICNKILKSKQSLLKHKVSMHQNRSHPGKVTGFGASRRYHCTKCSYSTPYGQTLINHMRRHNGDRPYICDCGKSFTQSSSLTAHQKTHSDVTYFDCEICGKQFKHSSSLKAHLQVHGIGKYSCDVCNKNLKSRQTLQDHMHRHYNVKNFNCEHCGDRFVTRSELINHKKKHSLEKKIECHLCGYKTHTKKALIIHLKRHAGDKSFICSLCQQTFYTSGDLRRHHRVHTHEKPFTCPNCPQKFSHSTSLNKHMQAVHGLVYKWGDYIEAKEKQRHSE